MIYLSTHNMRNVDCRYLLYYIIHEPYASVNVFSSPINIQNTYNQNIGAFIEWQKNKLFYFTSQSVPIVLHHKCNLLVLNIKTKLSLYYMYVLRYQLQRHILYVPKCVYWDTRLVICSLKLLKDHTKHDFATQKEYEIETEKNI